MIRATNSDQVALQVDQHLADLDQIRAFPASTTRLMKAAQDDGVDFQTIVPLIECDPAVSTKLLSLANSPLYGSTRPVTTVGHAMVILGIKSVVQVAISIAAGGMFDSGQEFSARYRRQLFHQSIGVGTVSRIITRQCLDAHPDEAFLIGIVQELGQLVMLDALSDRYLAFAETAVGQDPTPAEREQFGVDHANLGQRCGNSWGLPAPITFAVANHHLDLDGVEDPLSRAVIVGRRFAQHWGLGFDEVADNGETDPIVESLPTSVQEELESECRESFEAVHQILAA